MINVSPILILMRRSEDTALSLEIIFQGKLVIQSSQQCLLFCGRSIKENSSKIN